MARTNKSVRSRNRKSGAASAGLWLSLGLAIGVTASLVLYDFIDTKFEDRKPRQTPGPKKSATESRATTTQQASPDSRFDFYTLLPELEVVIPEVESVPVQKQDYINPVPPPVDIPETRASGGFLLQAGSFQHHREADAMKARLALLGVEANIQTVKVDKDTWHRVRIGPYENLAKVNQIRDQLRDNQIDSLLMKARQ